MFLIRVVINSTSRIIFVDLKGPLYEIACVPSHSTLITPDSCTIANIFAICYEDVPAQVLVLVFVLALFKTSVFVYMCVYVYVRDRE